jgi:hypothetical protein
MISIMMPPADSQRARALTAVGTGLNGHLAVAGSVGSGLVVRTRPWTFSDASRKSAFGQTPFGMSLSFSHIAQPSTAAASGLCASKQYQEKARSAAAIGGALGPLPPRDPV